MCKWSEELKTEEEVAVGQRLIATSLLTVHDGITLAFAKVDQPEDCEAGVCLKTGWGVVLHFTKKQIEDLGLPQVGDEIGASIFARFKAGKKDHHLGDHTMDTFLLEINGEIHPMIFKRAFRGVRMDVVASPTDGWPPASKSKDTAAKNKTQQKIHEPAVA